MPNMFTQMDAVCHRFEELSIRLTSRIPPQTLRFSAG